MGDPNARAFERAEDQHILDVMRAACLEVVEREMRSGASRAKKVHWIERFEDGRLVVECADVLGMTPWALARWIAAEIQPVNVSAFLWMASAMEGGKSLRERLDCYLQIRAELEATREKRVADARKAADALHGKPGGSRDKQAQIRALWATGRYSSRDICAEQECAALDMSFSSARRALRNTPDPDS